MSEGRSRYQLMLDESWDIKRPYSQRKEIGERLDAHLERVTDLLGEEGQVCPASLQIILDELSDSITALDARLERIESILASMD